MLIPQLNLNAGKDNRTIAGKLIDFTKVLVIVYLVVVHLFAALYLTNNKLVLKVESPAPAFVSPVPSQ